MVFVATTDRPAAAPSEQLSHVTASNGGNLVSHASAAPQSQPAPRAAGAAQDDAVVGSCIVLLKVLGAVLPPPFPSRQPARFYVGSLAVQPGWRRRGIGTAMLKAAETLGVHRCHTGWRSRC
jgi:ribosomal protein S18 acetylase RimI-like enzyme